MLNNPSTELEAAPQGRKFVVAALMMAVSLAALDTSVVGTAMPTIVGSLGGLKLFSWVFSIYLLTSTVTVPIYGKLADLYGRKPVILFGAVLFLVGSGLCGAAQSMVMLIVFRAIQGLGAGAVLPITLTIIGDIFTIEQRARIQGFFSGVWGVTGVAGPALGGLITDNISWRWVFYVNLPFGIASILLLSLYYMERTEKRSHVLDYWGAVLLSSSVIALLVGLLQGVKSYGWLGGQTLGLFATSALLLGVFVWQELRAKEPVMPLSLFRNRVIVVSSLAILLAGGLMFGVSSYVPLFEQGVFGGSATQAGLVLAPMSLSWVAGSFTAGRVILRFGYYPAAMVGGASLLLGSVVLLGLSADTSIMVAVVAGLIIGLGMGYTTNATVISVQNAVDWGQRGIATALIQFFRTIGGSISVAVMGALLNSRMSQRLAAIPGTPANGDADVLVNRSQREQLPEAVLNAMQHALSASLHEMFFIVFAAAALCLAAVSFFPKGRVTSLASTRSDAPRPAPALSEPSD